MIPHNQLHSVMEATIGSNTWSDHAPIFLKYKILDTNQSDRVMWKRNESLLQDPEVLQEVQREAICFFQINDTPECIPGVIWEAHKAVIRGVLMKHGARIKGKREEKLTLLLADIYRLESLHKHAPTQDIEQDLMTD